MGWWRPQKKKREKKRKEKKERKEKRKKGKKKERKKKKYLITKGDTTGLIGSLQHEKYVQIINVHGDHQTKPINTICGQNS